MCSHPERRRERAQGTQNGGVRTHTHAHTCTHTRTHTRENLNAPFPSVPQFLPSTCSRMRNRCMTCDLQEPLGGPT